MSLRFVDIRIFLLKLMILSIPFGGIKIYFPQLNLPTFLFFLYLIFSIQLLFKGQGYTHLDKPVVFLLIIYCIIFAVSFINFVPNYEGGYSFLRQFPIFITLFHFVSKDLINEKISPDTIMRWFVAGMVILVLMFLFNIKVDYYQVGRLSIMGLNANYLAISFSLAILITLNRLYTFEIKKTSRIGSLVLILLMTYITVLTASRGGIIGLLLGLFVYFYFLKRDVLGRFKTLLQSLFVIIIMIALFLSNDLLYNRVFNEDEAFGENRFRIWSAALDIVKDDLLYGVGVFRYQEEINTMLGRIFSTHNEFLSILMYSGVIGVFLFIYFIYFIIRSAFKTFKFTRSPLYLSLMIIVTFTLFKSGGSLLTMSLWVILTMCFAAKDISYLDYSKEDA
jgi:hypothetical protein